MPATSHADTRVGPTASALHTPAQIAERNRQRLSTLSRECAAGARMRTHNVSVAWQRRILVVESHKLLYCSVPKVGNTNWKRVLLSLLTEAAPLTISFHTAHHSADRLRTLDSYPAATRRAMLRSFYKFVFVREPYERFLSAFRNKVLGIGGADEAYARLVGGAIWRARGNVTQTTIWSELRRHPPTFAEFIRYVVARWKRRGSLDKHWTPVADLCSVCDVGYDFVGKLETVDEDASYLLRALGVGDRVAYPSKVTSGYKVNESTTKAMRSEYGRLTTIERDRVRELFARDFTLFGYDPTF
ncbi:PREDICTED: carbohydrate sulfotransferase 11-like [Priapulus caudatus]|uniref:Carbohydrate sulfotransferase n=1 Tax=Priapulus caudatus TaxID=37621 RepID=A0ABM1ENB7_PRICU|nr:PREDICTED: carbohydrate sulfotransferase 11-like [Priapulus caudatus]